MYVHIIYKYIFVCIDNVDIRFVSVFSNEITNKYGLGGIEKSFVFKFLKSEQNDLMIWDFNT